MTLPATAAEPFATFVEEAGSASAALAAGDSERAHRAASEARRAIPGGEAGARALLLESLALRSAGRPAEAAAGFLAALPSLPVTLRPAVLARLGEALAASGDPAGAAGAYARAAAAADPQDRPRLAAAEAQACLAAGETGRAARAAGPAAAQGNVAARLALASAWRADGDPRAPGALRDLAVERAGEPEGEEAAALLPASGSPGALSPDDRAARARRLLASARTRPALAEVDEIDRQLGPSPLGAVLRGMALLQLGQPALAERVVSPIAALPGPGDPAAARYVLARATVRQGRLDEAARLYRRVSEERPTVPGLSAAAQGDLADDAAFLAAWLPYDAGRFAESVPLLRRFARERPAARRAPDARWFAAWALVRAGDRDRAREALRELATREAGAPRAGALYWLGNLEPDRDRAATAWRDAVAEAPGGWYALLATSRLAALGEGPPRPAPLPPTPLPEPPRDVRMVSSLALAVELASAGLRDESDALLQQLSRAPDVRARAALLAEVAAFVGDAEVPHRMARDFLAPGIRAQRWSWPSAHAPILDPAARALGVDPALALAVMRRESAFVASARSGAAAEGILQLRPETARRLSALLGVDPARDLGSAGENVRLGVAYLALLCDPFALAPVALAAYNAGPAAAGRWSREHAGVPLDQWVEDVPYRETRAYVRAVVADWFRYRALRGEDPPALEPWQPVPPPHPGVAF